MEKLKELVEDLHASLEEIQHMEGNPSGLYEPISYILQLGGKRIRPALVLAAYRLYKKTYSPACMMVAQAVEMFHNFTLLHDDIMDRADLRRGQATVHKKWDEPTAILSGDLLQILVYKKLAEVDNPSVLPLFNSMAIELCEGQMSDMLFEQRDDVSNEEYIEMIRQKTAVLVGFSLQAGALLGGASQKDSETLYQLGIDIGLAFQLMDDYLDSFGQQAAVGKRIGGDILEKKKTFLWNAMWDKLNADDKANIQQAYTLAEEETIAMVKDTMKITGADEEVKNLAMDYSNKAHSALAELNAPEDKSYLEEIVSILAVRKF